LALRIWTSVSIGAPQYPAWPVRYPVSYPDFIGYGRASSGLDANDSDPQTIVLQALWYVLETVGIVSWRATTDDDEHDVYAVALSN
jgi:hypothetical protein